MVLIRRCLVHACRRSVVRASRTRRGSVGGVLGGLVLGLFAAGLAAAQSFSLTQELQTGLVDEFGVVHVEADEDGALVFDVMMDPARVGPNASIRRLFFNLLPETSDLWIEPVVDDADVRLVVRKAHRKLARSGARLDWRVDVHLPANRARRNPDPSPAEAGHHVRFRILADLPLVAEDLLPVSLTREGTPVQMVATLQRSRTPAGERVRWVAGTYAPPQDPEDPEDPPILR